MRSFRQLEVWQRAIELTFAIYELTKHFPPDERFGLTSNFAVAPSLSPATSPKAKAVRRAASSATFSA